MTGPLVRHERVNLLARGVIDAAVEVHRCLGPGLLEAAYAECLCHELRMRGLVFDRAPSLPLRYKGHPIVCECRHDLVVGGCVVVEVEAGHTAVPLHAARLATGLRLRALPLGLLINFNVPDLRSGVLRLAGPAACVVGSRVRLHLAAAARGSGAARATI
ncbi:MAG TPA: GxxExxY protein [Gemmatimonadales bacterium]|nr:GxxExxY protein [Gemmatimonadales bacterium]